MVDMAGRPVASLPGVSLTSLAPMQTEPSLNNGGTSCGWNKVPTEIKLEILSHCGLMTRTSITALNHSFPREPTHLSLALVNKELHSLATEFYYKRNTFNLGFRVRIHHTGNNLYHPRPTVAGWIQHLILTVMVEHNDVASPDWRRLIKSHVPSECARWNEGFGKLKELTVLVKKANLRRPGGTYLPAYVEKHFRGEEVDIKVKAEAVVLQVRAAWQLDAQKIADAAEASMKRTSL